ncbi:MAG: DUF3883 domain-containing protein [Anaerolineales bacterium]|nr:DUF3883 domain-containing protein [Anaerolineales bacterium]
MNIPRQLQNRAGTTGLIDFLEINTKPTPPLVVRHLKEYSRQNVPVNREVYRFLNDNSDDPAVANLNGTTCLLLPNNQYVRPDQVFWSEHPFGSYRYQLGPELRQYHSLFERLGVRERPEDHDFIEVLLEISLDYAQSHSPRNEQSLAIVMCCWEELSVALDQERLTVDELAVLKDHPVIPNNQYQLIRPEDIFFEDRAGLAAKFPQFLENNVIARPQGAWRAMSKVGVRLLGDAVELHMIECEGDVDDEALSALVQERHRLLNRIIESEKVSATDGLNITILGKLHFRKARKLLINYSLQAFKQKRTTDPEAVPALYLKDEAGFIAVYENGNISWPAIAREMASAIKPIGEIGGLAGGIKEVLASASMKEAERSLDELGYPPLQEHLQTEVEPSATIQGLGGEVLPAEESTDPTVGDTGLPETPAGVEETLQPGAGGNIGSATPSGETASPTSGDGISETSSETTAGSTATTGSGTSSGDGRPSTTTGTGSGDPGRKSLPKRKPTGGLRTYVSSNNGDTPSTSDPDGHQRRTTIGQIGVDRVLAYETECGRTARDTNETHRNHPGYDVESTDTEGNVRYIEVKSMEGYWSRRTPASVTRAQFGKAQELGDQFWLYVVEFAPDDERYQVFPIQDPFGKVNQYLFDDGWQELAEIEEQPETPEK